MIANITPELDQQLRAAMTSSVEDQVKGIFNNVKEMLAKGGATMSEDIDRLAATEYVKERLPPKLRALLDSKTPRQQEQS